MPTNGLFFSLKECWRALTLSLALLLALLGLGACATPQPPVNKVVFDFGPTLAATATATATTSSAAAARHQVVALPEIEAGAGLDSPALLYRLAYSDAQQLRPYTQARWSVPPAQLVRARLRDALAVHGPVLMTEGLAVWSLRVELDEFSQIFDSTASSQGTVRLRASLLQGDKLMAQTSVLARAAAPVQDAAGGVKALTAATDDALRQIVVWAGNYLKN
jgi:cholesterol transport system auxiliary component